MAQHSGCGHNGYHRPRFPIALYAAAGLPIAAVRHDASPYVAIAQIVAANLLNRAGLDEAIRKSQSYEQDRAQTLRKATLMKHRFFPVLAALLATAAGGDELNAASTREYDGFAANLAYADMADMALVAPITIAATILKSTALKAENAIGVPPGKTRYYIEAHADALIAGRSELPQTIRYLADLPAAKKQPKLKGQQVLLLAEPGARPGEIRLIGPKAQIARTENDETRLRSILKAAIAPDAPPAITGVGHAFHVAGSLPGEGETQIFLKTAANRPISLSILRRPGEAAQWAVALSELTDASAAPPERDTLLWYRLACGLPRALPDDAVAGLQASDATIAREDYRTVLTGLGPCRGN